MRMSVPDNPFCLVTDEAGRIMYVTDRIEGQNRRYRKVIKAKVK